MKSYPTEHSPSHLRNRFRSTSQIMKWHKILLVVIIYPCVFLGLLPAMAQPSGGPYGPVRQTYELPKITGQIYYVAPDGKTAATGKTLALPTTIEAAMERVKTGDAIVMREGTYRTGNLILNQGITMQAYQDEQPVLKGTLIADTWKDLRNGLWTTSWRHLFPAKPADWWQRDRRGKETPLYRFNNDMVFVDGRFLQAVGWEGEVDEHSYYIDYEAGLVYIGIDPANHMVEITAFDLAMLRTTGVCHGKTTDKRGPVIRGITFTQYAYRAIEVEGTNPEGLSPEASHGKEVIGTILEHCTISFCSRVAAYLRGDRLTIRNCKVSDTGTEGVYILSSSDVLLEKNIFTRNNIENITGYFPAAVKIFNQCYRVTCQDNLVIDLPWSNGIWYDVGNVDGRFLNNWVEGVGQINRKFAKNQPWPSENGFFFEISKGAVCAGNVFVNCDQGILVLNSSNVMIYQNTLVNSTVCIGRNERSAVGDLFGWHPSTGPGVDERDGHEFVNNLLSGDQDFHRPLLFVWQPESLCERLSKPQLKQLDYNIYVRGSDNETKPLIIWSPAMNDGCQVELESPGKLHELVPEFSTHSSYFAGYNVFRSYELGHYQLQHKLPGTGDASPLPDEIRLLLGHPKKVMPYIGAYPR